jgi:hypothetical protein
VKISTSFKSRAEAGAPAFSKKFLERPLDKARHCGIGFVSTAVHQAHLLYTVCRMYITQLAAAAVVLLVCRCAQRLLLLRQSMRGTAYSAKLLPYI